jgi:hypothetical protein
LATVFRKSAKSLRTGRLVPFVIKPENLPVSPGIGDALRAAVRKDRFDARENAMNQDNGLLIRLTSPTLARQNKR